MTADRYISRAIVELDKARGAVKEADLDEIDVVADLSDTIADLVILNRRIRAVRATL